MTTQLISFVGLKPTGFSLGISRYPDTTFPIQTVILPSVSMGSAIQNTPQMTIKHPGEKATYAPLSLTFLLNSDMSNYISLLGWMKQNAAPQGPSDIATLQQMLAQNTTNDNGQEYFSDITLGLLDNNNNPTVGFKFVDAFPTSLSAITMTTTASGMEYLTCDAVFDYTNFEVVSQ
jgi:hypothetical protein